MRLNNLSREELLVKYKQVNKALKWLCIFAVAVTALICFLPGWLLNWLGSLKKGRSHRYDPNNNDPSWFQQDGIQSVFIMLGAFVALILIVMLITNWFGLYRRVKENDQIP
jgi:Na+/melibiose symporter-like transporter